MRVRVDATKFDPDLKITVWAFRNAENKVIVENILKVVSVPSGGISQEEVPDVAMTVVQNMRNENLLEAIPPRMRLTDDQVKAMKDNDDPVSWKAFLKMSSNDKQKLGKATQETPQQRIARVDAAKQEAEQKRKDKADKKAKSDRIHAPGIARRARNAAKPKSANEESKRENQSRKDKADAAVSRAQSEAVQKEGGMFVEEPRQNSAMRSNPYFL